MRLDLLSASTSFEDFSVRIKAHAAARPDAVVLKDGKDQKTWREFADTVRRGAAALAGLKVAPGCRVALVAENGVPFVEVFFSIIASGACAVTIPTMVPPDVMARILENAAPSLIVVSERLAGSLHEAVTGSKNLSTVTVIGLRAFHDLMRDTGDRDNATAPKPEDDFNIVYSSGTTGEPKGILHSYATRVAQSRGMAGLGFDENTVTLISTPLYTNLSIPALLATVWGGGKAVIMEKFEERAFLELAARQRATHFYLVPVQVQRLIERPDFASYDLSSTRLVYVAGSMFQPAFKKKLQQLWPGALVEVYGMTEGAPASLLFIRDNPEKLTSVGKPVPGCEVLIIDDDGNELSVGQVGEIIGRSGTMMKGYYNRPLETEELIWRDKEGRVYFRSGDVGYLDADGFLYIVDRKKDMIISGGLNVYASDIEEVIMSHNDIAEAAVVGVPSARWGETPVAVVTAKPHAVIQPEALQQWINDRVGKHQRVAAVEIRDALPRNAMGKVLKRDLRAELVKSGMSF